MHLPNGRVCFGDLLKVFKKHIITLLGVFWVSSVLLCSSYAQDSSLEDIWGEQYLIDLSGTVGEERFSGAQALLTLMDSSHFDPNPHLLIIEAFPERNARNSIFLNSETVDMEVLSNEVTCEFKRSLLSSAEMFFFYMSPILYASHQFREEERPELRKDVIDQFGERIPPTLIRALAGKLKIRIFSNRISGSIWMKGYDKVERAFVLYSAQIRGTRVTKSEQKKQLRK